MSPRPFSYDGKRVIVTGAASGMGAATVALLAAAGAETYALDVAPVGGPVARAFETDCGDPASIDAALDAIGAPVHCVFNVAGVPQTHASERVLAVNLLGLRHLTERVIDGAMGEGGAIAHVASTAGSTWANHLAEIKELLATDDFAAGTAWAASNLDALGDPYLFSKECVVVYTMMRAHGLIPRGIRMNCLSPGPVDSPMLPAFREARGDAMLDWIAAQVGRMGHPEEMAGPLLFLNSDEASYVNGHNLLADGGFTGAMALRLLDLSTIPRG